MDADISLHRCFRTASTYRTARTSAQPRCDVHRIHTHAHWRLRSPCNLLVFCIPFLMFFVGPLHMNKNSCLSPCPGSNELKALVKAFTAHWNSTSAFGHIIWRCLSLAYMIASVRPPIACSCSAPIPTSEETK